MPFLFSVNYLLVNSAQNVFQHNIVYHFQPWCNTQLLRINITEAIGIGLEEKTLNIQVQPMMKEVFIWNTKLKSLKRC